MIEIYCDGGASPNPGLGGIGFILYRGKKILLEGYQYLGNKITNNMAEFTSIINALSVVHVYYPKEKDIVIKMDSQLVVNSFPTKVKKWTIRKKHLIVFYNILEQTVKKFDKITIEKITREENKLADKLSKIARKQKRTKIIMHGS